MRSGNIKLHLASLVMLILSISMNLHAGDRVAILIGLSRYAYLGDTLHGASDAHTVGEALHRQGFLNISTLTDRQATKFGILAVLRDSTVLPGQTMVILLAGHGSQISDDNDLDDEPDKFDEAFVPYDGVLNERGSLLTDDELFYCLERIREKLGERGELLLLIDACYGGGLTRTFIPAQVRGLRSINHVAPAQDKHGWLDSEPSASTSGIAPLIVICASQPNELSFEVKDASGQLIGPLSWSFCQALVELDRDANYQALFQRIQAQMYIHARRQSPLMFGNANRRLFGGIAQTRQLDFQITDTSRGIVNGGTLLGWQTGDTLELYRPSGRTTGESSPIGVAVIADISQFHSQIRWLGKPPSPDEQLTNSIQHRRTTDRILRLAFIADCRGDSTCVGFCDALVAANWLQPHSGEPALRIVSKSGQWLLADVSGTTFWEGSASDSTAAKLAIRRYAIAYGLAHFQAQDQPCKTALNLFHADGNCRLLPSIPAATFAIGDTFGFQLLHQGSQRTWTYVFLLDSGKATLLLPIEPNRPSPLALAPGDSINWNAQCWVLTCPGTTACATHIKLIASSQPLDLRPIFDADGQLRGGMIEHNPARWPLHTPLNRSQATPPQFWTQDIVLWPKTPPTISSPK